MDWTFDLQEGQQLTGLRAVMVAARGTMRGTVKLNQPIPAGLHVYVYAHWMTAGNTRVASSLVNERGEFLLEKLPAGDYEFSFAILTGDLNRQQDFVPPPFKAPPVRISHTGEGEVSVTLTLEFIAGGNQ